MHPHLSYLLRYVINAIPSFFMKHMLISGALTFKSHDMIIKIMKQKFLKNHPVVLSCQASNRSFYLFKEYATISFMVGL